jgi:hypothetical protein
VVVDRTSSSLREGLVRFLLGVVLSFPVFFAAAGTGVEFDVIFV